MRCKTTWNPRSSPADEATLCGASGSIIANVAARLFFPQAGTLGIDPDCNEKVQEPSDPRRGRPEIFLKSVIATRQDIHAFGQQLATAAWQRGFAAAERKAFVCDGAAANWTVW